MQRTKSVSFISHNNPLRNVLDYHILQLKKQLPSSDNITQLWAAERERGILDHGFKSVLALMLHGFLLTLYFTLTSLFLCSLCDKGSAIITSCPFISHFKYSPLEFWFMEVWKMWFPLDCASTKPATESGTFKVKWLSFFPPRKRQTSNNIP